MTLKQLLPLLRECQRIGAEIGLAKLGPKSAGVDYLLQPLFAIEDYYKVDEELRTPCKALIIGALKNFAKEKGYRADVIWSLDHKLCHPHFNEKRRYDERNTAQASTEIEAFLKAFVATFGGEGGQP